MNFVFLKVVSFIAAALCMVITPIVFLLKILLGTHDARDFARLYGDLPIIFVLGIGFAVAAYFLNAR